jgi:hypothetical protein
MDRPPPPRAVGALSICILAAACATLSPFARADGLRFSAGYDFSTGTYGSTERTDVNYFPFLVRYERDDVVFRLTVPYLRVTGPGTIVGGDNPIVLQQTTTQRTSAEGLGDVVAAATYPLVNGTGGWFVDATAKIKFGTANADKGLGTGENDYGLQLDFTKVMGAFSPLASVGYRVMGSSEQIQLRNVWGFSAGAAYRFEPGLSAGAYYDFRQAAAQGSAPLRELTGYVLKRLGDHWRLQFYVTHGFSDGSPDWGGGVNAGYDF